MTCSRRSAPATSSSVARNAATSVCGSRSMKPTVSPSRNSQPVGHADPAHQRVERHEQRVGRGSALARQLVEQRRLARVRVADERDGRLRAPCAAARADSARRRRTTSICREMAVMRWRMRRRSVSSFVSPGPRVPMPPPSRDRPRRAADQPRQQVLELRQLDLELALHVCAPARRRCRGSAASDRRPCGRAALRSAGAAPGPSSLSKITRSALDSSQAVGERGDLAAAEEGRRVRPRPLLQHAQHHRGARRLRQTGQLVERSFGVGAPRRCR